MRSQPQSRADGAEGGVGESREANRLDSPAACAQSSLDWGASNHEGAHTSKVCFTALEVVSCSAGILLPCSVPVSYASSRDDCHK